MVAVSLKKIFFKQKTAYEITTRLVGSEMCIRDSLLAGAVYALAVFYGRRQLDGMSGDISGFALTLGELAGVAVVTLVR